MVLQQFRALITLSFLFDWLVVYQSGNRFEDKVIPTLTHSLHPSAFGTLFISICMPKADYDRQKNAFCSKLFELHRKRILRK